MISRTATDAWLYALKTVLATGQDVHIERVQQSTREVQLLQLRLPLRRAVVACPARKLSYRFMAAEALWILEGRDDVATIAKHLERYREFSDDGVRLAGAYGPRFVAQLPYVVRTLRDDHTSRQAVVSLWEPSPAPSRDIPCTLSLQWFSREGRLHCFVVMRSSDLWLGLPYDLLTFTCMTYRVLQELRMGGVTPGLLHWTAGSAHLYERDQEAARELLMQPAGPEESHLVPQEWEVDHATMLAHLTEARDLAGNHVTWRLRPW